MPKVKQKSKAEVLEEYISFRGMRNHESISGINDIRFKVKQFLESSKKDLGDFDEHDLIAHVKTLQPKLTTVSLNITKAFFKNFLKWYFIDWSSRFRNLDVICRSEKAQSSYSAGDMITEEDFKKLMEKEDSLFWKAYFMTLFYGACRPIEVCLLKWDAVEFEKGDNGAYITIYSKKNKKSFIKYVPQDVAFYLKKLKNNGSEFVFYHAENKKPIDRKMPYWRIKALTKKALGKVIDLYTLRHSIATIIYNKDMNDDDIAKQMGHSKSMKHTYVHNHKDRLKELVRKIYIKTDDLPPEKKAEYEERIRELEASQNNMQEALFNVMKKLKMQELESIHQLNPHK